MKKIAIASDHAGFVYKEKIKENFKNTIQFVDFGTHSDQSMDYPDAIHPAALAVENKEVEVGIILCGSGNGAQITANKHQGIRAALCWNTELAELARQHNDANILTLPARFVSYELALEMISKFLTTDFEGGRHQTRVDKIACK